MKKLFLIIIAFSLFGCGGNNDGRFVEESGTIETTDIIISSKVGGTVEEIKADEGSNISKGDTILTIDHETLDIQLRQAEAGLDGANAQFQLVKEGARKEDINQAKEAVKQAGANLESAKSDLSRLKSLYESQAITEKQFEDVKTRADIAESQYQSAKANLEKMNNISRPAEIKQAEANYGKTAASVDLIEKQIRDSFIISPIRGSVVEVYAEEGENVNPQTSLVKVSNLSEVELIIYISETDLGKVKTGQDAEVSIDTFPDKTYNGKITYISPEAEFTPKNIQTKDERTKLVFKVKIKIPNPAYELKAGMPADAKIILDEIGSGE